MILTRTDSGRIAALNDQPRRVHHAGVWFADDDGLLTHRMNYDLWVQLGEPQRIEFDMEGVDLALAQREAGLADAEPETPPRLRVAASPPIRPVNRAR